jgi:hypothetical protein
VVSHPRKTGPFSFCFARYQEKAGMELPKGWRRKAYMKKQNLKIFAMLSLLLAVAAMSVVAEASGSAYTRIPFSFTVGNKTLPAGEYIVEPYRKDYDRVWLVQSRDGRSTALVNTNSVRSANTQEKGKLVFKESGGEYSLSQIWTAGTNSGRELRVQTPKDELAKNTGESQTVVIAIGER